MAPGSRLRLCFAFLPLLAGVLSMDSFARSTGITGRSVTGCTCHGTSSGVVTFSIAGPAVLPANTQGTYTLTINGGLASAMGIDMTVSSGTLGLVTTTNLALASNEIRHTSPLTNRAITFTVTAPSSGTSFTIFYSGVAGFNDWSSGNNATALAVQLTSFTVQVIPENFAKLDWATSSEINNYGFRIQRRPGKDAQFADLPGVFIAGHGTTSAPQTYAFTDRTAGPGIWSYRLNQIDQDGSNHFSDEVTVSVLTGVEETAPVVYGLMQNYPNPFNPSTLIQYDIPKSGYVSLKVYDNLGKEVAALVDGEMAAGRHSIQYRPANLASGTYFYRIQSGEFIQSRKFILLK